MLSLLLFGEEGGGIKTFLHVFVTSEELLSFNIAITKKKRFLQDRVSRFL